MFVTGDTHANLLGRVEKLISLYGKAHVLDKTLVILGDFSVLWADTPDFRESGQLEEVNYLCELYNLSIAFLDGNHENFNRLNALPEKDIYGSKVGIVSDYIFHLKRNRAYTIDGKLIYVLGGADSIDRGRRIENVSWWFDESITDVQVDSALKDLSATKFDYFFTHEAPSDVKNILLHRHPEFIIGGGIITLPSNEQMDKIQEHKAKTINKTTPWWFGHYHMDDNLELDGVRYETLYGDILEI